MLKKESQQIKQECCDQRTDMQNGMQNITRYNKEWYEPQQQVIAGSVTINSNASGGDQLPEDSH